jgi:hypothetical protein
MAAWQFELDPIPAHLASIDGVSAIHLSREARENISLGLSPDDRKTLVRTLDDHLPRQQSWSAGLVVWGNTRASDVQLYRDESGSDTMHIRIDAKTFSTNLIEAMCDIAKRFDWVFVTEAGAVLPPRQETVLRALLNSSARRFVEGTDSIIAEAAERVYQPA